MRQTSNQCKNSNLKIRELNTIRYLNEIFFVECVYLFIRFLSRNQLNKTVGCAVFMGLHGGLPLLNGNIRVAGGKNDADA